MNKILELLDFLILATQEGLRWDFIESQESTEEAYYRILSPESKNDLITLRSRGKDNISLKLIGNKLTLTISSTYFFSVKNKLGALYDEVRLSSLLSENKLRDVHEEIDRVILMLE